MQMLVPKAQATFIRNIICKIGAVRIIGVLLALSYLSACQQKPQAVLSSAASSSLALQTEALLLSSNGCFQLTSNWQQQHVAGNYFSFDFEIVKSCIAANAIGSIQFFASMPAHKHGMNSQPSLQQITPTRYRVDGIFLHMPGAWHMSLEIPYTAATGAVQLETVEFDSTL